MAVGGSGIFFGTSDTTGNSLSKSDARASVNPADQLNIPMSLSKEDRSYRK